MANQWYFARDGEEFGPFSATQLKELAAAGRVRPQDTVWTEGAEKRVPAVRVKHLFSAPPAAPPPDGPGGQEVSAPAVPEPPPQSLTLQATPPAPTSDTSEEARLLSPGDGTSAAAAVPPKTSGTGRPESRPLPAENEPRPPHQETKTRRVLDIKGGVVTSQDGVSVKFRKKCLKCGYSDTSLATMPIRPGVTRVNFFCPKCKKSQQVEVRGMG